MKNLAKSTKGPKGQPNRDNLPSRKAPNLQRALRRRHLPRLHQEIRRVIPAFNGLLPFSQEQMDLDYQTAMEQRTAQDFKFWYLEANLLKRYEGRDLSDEESATRVALEKLLESNDRCQWSNRVFAAGLGNDNPYLSLGVLRTLRKARKEIASILGSFPWERFPWACGFTPGATTEFPRRGAQLHNKWHNSSHVSLRALPYATAFKAWTGLTGEQPGGIQLGGDFTIVECNSVFTVPKNAWSRRAACRPVTWSGFLQKGVGKLIRQKARARAGLLQPDAQEYHGVLAKLASWLEMLSCRDLSAASDSICVALVDCLVPPAWSKVLMDLRETHGILPDGTTVEWNLMSTMGNGFTFELETVLFYGIVRACCSKDSLVSVYGDDIIFPQKYQEKVDEVLTACGFRVNRDKSSNTRVPFRESCGAHYFAGVDVKPFYIQKLPTTLAGVINLHNDIVRWHQAYPSKGSRWHRVWSVCRELVPREFWGAPGTQGVLWCEWDEARPVYDACHQAFVIAGVTLKTEEPRDLHDHVGAYLQKLWTKEREPWESGETSTYRETGQRETSCWLYVDRAAWGRITAETLCN